MTRKSKAQIQATQEDALLVEQEEKLPLAKRRIVFTSLSTRTRNCLKEDFRTVGEVMSVHRSVLLRIPNMGRVSVIEFERYIGRPLAEHPVESPRSILQSSLVSQSMVYKPSGSLYWYLVTWHEDQGYRLQRRLAPPPGTTVVFFWERSPAVENWIQSNGGRFCSSTAVRSIVKFASLEDVERIILIDAFADTVKQ